MLLIREVMHCKPGKVRPMVEKFVAMNKLGKKTGMPPMRVSVSATPSAECRSTPASTRCFWQRT